MQYTQSEYDNSIIVFLLRVDFLGVEHRFSSIPISYEGRDYIGSLSNVDYIETTNLVGFSAETNSVSLSCYFDGLDLLHEYRKGKHSKDKRPQYLIFWCAMETLLETRFYCSKARYKSQSLETPRSRALLQLLRLSKRPSIYKYPSLHKTT